MPRMSTGGKTIRARSGAARDNPPTQEVGSVSGSADSWRPCMLSYHTPPASARAIYRIASTPWVSWLGAWESSSGGRTHGVRSGPGRNWSHVVLARPPIRIAHHRRLGQVRRHWRGRSSRSRRRLPRRRGTRRYRIRTFCDTNSLRACFVRQGVQSLVPGALLTLVLVRDGRQRELPRLRLSERPDICVARIGISTGPLKRRVDDRPRSRRLGAASWTV